MENTRGTFIKQLILLTTAVFAGKLTSSAKIHDLIIGANDRLRVGVTVFLGSFNDTLFPSFQNYDKELNFDIVVLSDSLYYR